MNQHSESKKEVRRFGHIIKVKADKLSEYKSLHASPWPGVLEKIEECNIRNYSIFHQGDYLFSYYEYIGENYKQDMEKMSKDPLTQKWWSLCKPCQQPLSATEDQEWWTQMEEIFHH